MARAAPTVAAVFRRDGEAFRAQAGAALSTAQRRVMSAIEQCRTAALGGHVAQCDHCGHRRVWYHSCRNRHCPQCQALARATWIQARTEALLDGEYFHVVCTLPQPIAEIALQHKAVVYGLLFRTVAETLRIIAAEPTPPPDYQDQYEALTGVSLSTCPACHDGHMRVIETLARGRARPVLLDSS